MKPTPPEDKRRRVIVGIPVLLLGGTEVQTLSVVRVLAAAGHSVTVCCYHEFDPAIVTRFEQAGAEVVLLNVPRSDGLLALLFRLRSFFCEDRPDIVHVQYIAPGLIPIIAARLAGVRTVFATVHIAGEAAYGGKARFLLRIAARLCSAFICVSKGVEEFWFGDSMLLEPGSAPERRRHFTIYNAVDTEVIRSIATAADREGLRQGLDIPLGAPVIGIVGRLTEQKGHTQLLDAFAEVVTQFPRAVLLVIGDGPLRPALIEKADRLGISCSVYWLGSRPQEEVFRLYAAMDLFVMPSIYEGFGLTAAEAMAAGLPVVATRIHGLTEVVADGETGYLVPLGQAEALADSLKGLLANRAVSKEMGAAGRRRVEKLFSMNAFSSAICSLYQTGT